MEAPAVTCSHCYSSNVRWVGHVHRPNQPDHYPAYARPTTGYGIGSCCGDGFCTSHWCPQAGHSYESVFVPVVWETALTGARWSGHFGQVDLRLSYLGSWDMGTAIFG